MGIPSWMKLVGFSTLDDPRTIIPRSRPALSSEWLAELRRQRLASTAEGIAAQGPTPGLPHSRGKGHHDGVRRFVRGALPERGQKPYRIKKPDAPSDGFGDRGRDRAHEITPLERFRHGLAPGSTDVEHEDLVL